MSITEKAKGRKGENEDVSFAKRETSTIKLWLSLVGSYAFSLKFGFTF